MNNFRFAIVLILIIFNSSIYSQVKEQTEGKIPRSPDMSGQNKTTTINADAPQLFGSINDGNVQNKLVPVEDMINPDTYIVGPNDLFSLGIYGFVNQQVPIYVNLEGSLIVPTIGEIKIGGLNLREAKEKVIKAVKKRYYSSDVSFTLSTPRSFLIRVAGMTQGTFEVNSVTRATQILSRLFFDTLNIYKREYFVRNKREYQVPEMSLRNIELHHKNGTILRIDLYKFYLTNDPKYNPYFVEGDLLKIPYGLLYNNYTTIEGALQLPGLYEYSPDDDLETVIGLGRGFDTDAQKDSVLLFRQDKITGKFDIYVLNYETDKDFEINVFDRIYVKRKSSFEKNLSVIVQGEVSRPGYYPITFKNSRIKDVIELAGGMNNTAYLPLCIVFRSYDKEYTARDSVEIIVNMRGNDILTNEKEIGNFKRDIISRRNRVVVDFEKLYKENDESQNIILEDKDIIYINDNKNVVYVYGSVGNEGYVPYKEGAGCDYYIEKAGGYGLGADDENTRVIKFNSRGWYKPEETKVLSGDFVYVPKKIKSSFTETLAVAGTIAGILLGIISTYLLILNAQK